MAGMFATVLLLVSAPVPRVLFLFYAYIAYLVLLSFPTRRSSDLDATISYTLGHWRRAYRWGGGPRGGARRHAATRTDRKSTRLNSSHGYISYAVFCLKKKKHESVMSRSFYQHDQKLTLCLPLPLD